MLRNMKIKRLIVLMIGFLFLLSSGAAAKEKTNSLCEPFPIEATAYCHGSITASGTKPRIGICAAKREWIGKTAIVYQNSNGEIGDLIGIYEIQDTGSDYRIKNGTCIDIYMPDKTDCREFGRKQIWLQIVEAKG